MKMKKWFLLPLLALCLTAGPPASAEQPPFYSAQDKTGAIAQFKERSRIEKTNYVLIFGEQLSVALHTPPDFIRKIRERGDIPNREEAMAVALISKEAETIGLTPDMEVRKTDETRSRTGLTLRYKPYLNGIQVDDAYIDVNMLREDIYMNATIFRLTPEIRQALAAPQLPRSNITRIVLDHLEPQVRRAWQQWRRQREWQRWRDRRKWHNSRSRRLRGEAAVWEWWCGRAWRKGKKCEKIESLERVITLKPPYLAWKAVGFFWEYRIDAFSGQVLWSRKYEQGARPAAPSRPSPPSRRRPR